MDIFINVLFVLLPVVTGMEASGGMFTSSLGRRGLYHPMIMPINILTVMQMLTRFVAFNLHFILLFKCPEIYLATQCPNT